MVGVGWKSQGSSGGGVLIVQDEGITVSTNCSMMNFVGGHAGASFQAVETAPGVVTVYHPAPNLPPFFSATDVPTQSRRIATPTTERDPFSLGSGWAGGQFKEVVDHNQFGSHSTLPLIGQMLARIQSPGVCRFVNQTSTVDVQVTIYDADGTGDMVFSHSHGPISGNGSSSSNFITVTISSWSSVSSIWQAIIRVDMDVASMLFSIGDGRLNTCRWSYTVTHHDGGTNPSHSQTNLFYDGQPDRGTENAVMNDPPGPNPPIGLAEGPVVAIRPLSGIYYYDMGSQFDVTVYEMDHINADSSPDVQAVVNGWATHGLPSPLDIRCTDAGPLPNGICTGWVNGIHRWDEVNIQYRKQNWGITRANWRNFVMPSVGSGIPSPWPPQSRVEGHIIDWNSGPSLYSPVDPVVIDTYTQQSDELAEYFTDEDYRRTSSDAVWDSTQDITTYDGGNNGQVIGGLLVAPVMDFSGCHPLRPGFGSQLDYSSAGSGPFKYYRRFIDITGAVRTNAVLTIAGFTLQNLIDEDIRMWIDIPGKWTNPCYAHGPALYDPLTFTADNDPIRTAASVPPNQVAISFGTPPTGLGPAPDNFFIMHLEIVDTNIRPDSIVVTW